MHAVIGHRVLLHGQVEASQLHLAEDLRWPSDRARRAGPHAGPARRSQHFSSYTTSWDVLHAAVLVRRACRQDRFTVANLDALIAPWRNAKGQVRNAMASIPIGCRHPMEPAKFCRKILQMPRRRASAQCKWVSRKDPPCRKSAPFLSAFHRFSEKTYNFGQIKLRLMRTGWHVHCCTLQPLNVAPQQCPVITRDWPWILNEQVAMRIGCAGSRRPQGECPWQTRL